MFMQFLLIADIPLCISGHMIVLEKDLVTWEVARKLLDTFCVVEYYEFGQTLWPSLVYQMGMIFDEACWV